MSWDGFLGDRGPGDRTVFGTAPAGGWDSFLGPSSASAPALVINPPSGQTVSAPPPQISNWTRYPRMVGGAALSGLANAAGMPGDLEQALIGPSAPGEIPPWYQLPMTKEIQGTLGRAGLLNRADLQAEGPWEKALQAGIAGGASSILGIAAGAPPISSLATGVVSGVAGQAAHDLAPGFELPAGLLAGLGTQGLGSMAKSWMNLRQLTREAQSAGLDLSSARTALEDARLVNAETIQAASERRSAASATNAAELADKKTQLRGLMQRQIGAADSTAAAATSLADQTLEHVAGQIGLSGTLQEAGGRMQNVARDWLTNIMPQKMSSLWSPVDAAIPGQTAVPLNGFSDALRGINTSAGKLEPLVAEMKPSLPAKLLATLNRIGGAQGAKASPILGPDGLPIPGTPAPFTWQEVQKLRSALGEARRNPQVIRDLGAQNLDRLYATLTSDMESAAGSVSPQAKIAFQQANEASNKLYQFAEGPVSRVISGGKADLAADPKPEDVAKSLLAGGKSGASDLAALRAEMPTGVDELASAFLRTKGDWSKLSPEAQAALIADQGHFGTVDSMTNLRNQAVTNRLDEIKKAREGYASTLESEGGQIKASGQAERDEIANIISSARRDTRQKQEATLGASRAETEASTALAGAKEKRGDRVTHILESMLGRETGEALSMMGLPLPAAALQVAGLVAPPLYRGVKGILSSPGRLVQLPIGAGAGYAGGVSLPGLRGGGQQ